MVKTIPPKLITSIPTLTLLGLLVLDITLENGQPRLEDYVLPGSYLYLLELGKAQRHVARLFGPEGERLTRLTKHPAGKLYPAFDRVAPRIRSNGYTLGDIGTYQGLADLLPKRVDP